MCSGSCCDPITIFNGQDGKTILSGGGIPSSGIGNDGDFFINTVAHTIYGPKAAGSWGSPVSLVGPAGATGPQGIQGIQGIPGTNGTNGTNGINAVGIQYSFNTTITALTTIPVGEFALQGDWATFPTGGNGTIALSNYDVNGYGMSSFLTGLDDNNDGNGYSAGVVLTGINGVYLIVKIKTGTQTSITGGYKFDVVVTALSQSSVPANGQDLWFTSAMFGQTATVTTTTQVLTNTASAYNITDSKTKVILNATSAGTKEFDLTLPATAAVGDTIEILCAAVQNDFILRQRASQQIVGDYQTGTIGAFATTAGTGHGLTTSSAGFGGKSYYVVRLTCLVANTKWIVEHPYNTTTLGVIDKY